MEDLKLNNFTVKGERDSDRDIVMLHTSSNTEFYLDDNDSMALADHLYELVGWDSVDKIAVSELSEACESYRKELDAIKKELSITKGTVSGLLAIIMESQGEDS